MYLLLAFYFILFYFILLILFDLVYGLVENENENEKERNLDIPNSTFTK